MVKKLEGGGAQNAKRPPPACLGLIFGSFDILNFDLLHLAKIRDNGIRLLGNKGLALVSDEC